MSFLFKSKKPAPGTGGLPPATRNITSAHGERTMIPTANGLNSSLNSSLNSPRDVAERVPREVQKTQTPTPGSSVNASLNSIQSASPEPIGIREISDVDMPQQGDSPYPWSQRRLNFTAQANPFPRYGAAVNSSASKEGWIYLMGGLINSTTVKGDLWMVEASSGTMACYPVQTPSEGPGPRVGHSSLLVGNAFIVFGGDTKLQEEDVLDDTLYLLNTASKQWSKALPAGPRPSGRYGHTLNILGSKIYVFGGQVEGFFFNDLVAFDLNGLQVPGNRWQMLIPNSKDGVNAAGPVPVPRTNHTCVTWQDKLYLFGGTDGTRWFNDVWTYDPRTNQWSELDCIGYIPAPREGHAAALVDDTMYIFGGRVQDGSDLGDLAAFRISSRRWYMFQNMGMSPSARSGHSMTAFGKHIVVLGGEPSSAPHDPKELSLSYVLDTSKIRYPPSEGQPQGSSGSERVPPARKFSNSDRSTAIPIKQGAPGPGGPLGPLGPPFPRNQDVAIARPGTAPAGSGPPPTQQAPQPRPNGVIQEPPKPKKSQSQKPLRGPNGITSPFGRSNSVDSTEPTENPAAAAAITRAMSPRGRTPSEERHPSIKRTKSPPLRRSQDNSRPSSAMSRAGSRAARQQGSVSSIDPLAHAHARASAGSIDDTRTASRTASRSTEILAVDSGIGSSPALSQQNDELLRELEAARGRNAWYAGELALARKAGYNPSSSSGNQILDERAADIFGDDDRPLIEALLSMRTELGKMQGAIEAQAVEATNKVSEAEKQRDAAVNEAIYAKAKLAAHGGAGDEASNRDLVATPDADRIADANKRLAASLNEKNELSTRLAKIELEIETERRARHLAEDTVEAAEKRVAELDSYRQRAAGELESLRAELHEAERAAREEAANCAEAVSKHRLLEVDHSELAAKHAVLDEGARDHATVMENLREAVNTSSDKASLLETKLAGERTHREELEQQLSVLRVEHDNRSTELESVTRRLRDAEELAEKHAAEARTHREAVLSGLNKASSRALEDPTPNDQRVEVLQEQVITANALVRKNQDAADTASEKLRRAEERIAGLEAYQEQSSREGLTIRKQLQIAMRDAQAMQADKNELQQQLERLRLESNALEVQLKTLKNLLDERGVSAADRRSRALDSPSFRNFGTPDQNRVRELEQQLDASAKAHDDLRQTFEQREAENSREYEAKLANLENDHQAAVKYVRGIEKMLAKMKQELQRTKSAKDELEKELVGHRADAQARGVDDEAKANWEAEREALRREMEEVQESLRTSIAELENQIEQLKTSLDASEMEREKLQEQAKTESEQHTQQLTVLQERAHADLDHVRRENAVLAERAKDAENKVQMFLDQFESSVDNYRRQSRMPGAETPKFQHSSMAVGGEMKPPTSPTDMGATQQGMGHMQHARDRSSTALDSLASELESLRTHWETTNKNYRLSDKFDFERTPTGQGEDLGESLASWRRKLDLDEAEERKDALGVNGGEKM
ncbi:hypothetical protein NA57DRAFT_63290 [Rhizodiscina lignyota]|uniref:Uncharacterized protein n=1 Tax=Rhizodiscina lignyota TaxID=1504668 RepID=A0A9P4ISL5_9PEZI|nr:hypothetical protein NA57DRAFT_63290 [Rhizodiscina lignyota]